MAGKAYSLPRPRPDAQPQAAGAGPIAYAEGIDPRAHYAQSNATDTWHKASDSVTNSLHCNLQTRVSVAPALDDGAQRDLGVNTYTPGRKPAPRVSLSCVTAPKELTRPSSAYARDLALTRPERPPRNPDGGPLAGPGPTPTGLSPLPEPLGPDPRDGPTLIIAPPTAPPTISTELTAQLLLQRGDSRIPGTLEAINFHLTENIAGGSTTSEIRVFGPIANAFIVRQIWINGDSGVTAGQFLDILVAGDGDTTDVLAPSGESIFPLLEGLGSIPTPDGQRGIAIPPVALDLRLSQRVDLAGRWLKVQSLFVAPALALPNVHVTITIEHMDAPGMTVPTIIPRLPLLLPPGETPPPSTSAAAAGSPLASTTGQPYAATQSILPAWRVAALGLPPNLSGDVIGGYPLLDALTAWQIDPFSATAKPFADRIKTVLASAGVTGGNALTLVPTSAAIATT
jgi:hypothetical protein